VEPPPRITARSRAAWVAFAEAQGEKAYRGRQVFQWVVGRGVRDPALMTDLPRGFRESVAAAHDSTAPLARWSSDSASGTEKLLMPLSGGDAVEAVLILEPTRTTACLSSQAGCPVACRFCASGLLGLRRNLDAGEILDQFMELRQRAAGMGRRVSHIVMMGMGEPLLNYPAVVQALGAIHDPEGGGIGARHLTISTVGLEKGVERLLQDRLPYTLAFSLHAPTDELRRSLIPFEGALDIAGLVGAARRYLEVKGREVTFEYVLLHEVNDRPEHARALVARLRGVRATVNLIPYNENPGLPFGRPPPADIDAFAASLRAGGLKVTVRKRKGHRILAACGQLRLQSLPDGEAAVQPPLAGLP
jgi:23S rRNA (adenine2503-C2)-methyltransferase